MNFTKISITKEAEEKLIVLSSKHTDISAIQIVLNEQQWMFEIGAEFAQSYHSWTSMCFQFTKANFHPNDWSVFLFKINTSQFSGFDKNGKICDANTLFSQAPRWIAFVCRPSNLNTKHQIVNCIFLKSLDLIWNCLKLSLKHTLFPTFSRNITQFDITRLIESISANICFDSIKENNLSLLTVLNKMYVVVEKKNETVINVKMDSENQTFVKSILKTLPKIPSSAITKKSAIFRKIKFSDPFSK